VRERQYDFYPNFANFWLLTLLLAMFILPPQPPAPFSTATRLIPTSYMADAISLSLSGKATLGNVGLDLLVLAVSTAIVSVAVLWALRRERR
jgi:ABC-type multidrug transport system permease subunit